MQEDNAARGDKQPSADHGDLPRPTTSPFERQMRALNLRQQELYMHMELMETEVRYWPESLQDFVDKRQKALGLCGDVIAMAVADWIAHR